MRAEKIVWSFSRFVLMMITACFQLSVVLLYQTQYFFVKIIIMVYRKPMPVRSDHEVLGSVLSAKGGSKVLNASKQVKHH